MTRIEVVRAVVGDAGHDDLVIAVNQHDVLVHQHVHAQALELLRPRVRARVVLVIARDEVRAVARAQARQRRDVRRELRHAAVDQVAGHGDHVGIEAVHRVDDGSDVLVLDRRPDVHVADLRDREAVQLRRQVRDRHFDIDHGRATPRVEQADQRGQHRESRSSRSQ